MFLDKYGMEDLKSLCSLNQFLVVMQRQTPSQLYVMTLTMTVQTSNNNWTAKSSNFWHLNSLTPNAILGTVCWKLNLS